VLHREAEKADLQYTADPQKSMQGTLSRAALTKNEKIASRKKSCRPQAAPAYGTSFALPVAIPAGALAC